MHAGSDLPNFLMISGRLWKSGLNLRRRSIALLKIESERDLAYIYGRQPGILAFTSANQRGLRHSIIGRLAAFAKKLLSRLRLRRQKIDAEFLLFAGSDNQLKSLASTFESLALKGARVHILIGTGVRQAATSQLTRWSRIAVPIQIALNAISIAGSRYGVIRRELIGAPQRRYLDQFIWSYVYLPLFIDLLTEVRPRYVVMSNDHSVANRCLRIVAMSLGIRTVYLQHAAVSTVFPRLNFDIAFLDGRVSAEIYDGCKENPPLVGESMESKIFLSGHTRSFRKKRRRLDTSAPTIGIGVNPLDRIDSVIGLVNNLVHQRLVCIVRCHPAQASSFIHELECSMSSHGTMVSVSDSRSDSLDDFLDQCDLLIAANTSLHLEAALSGLPSYYFEFGPTERPDYYEFILRGIIRTLPSEWRDLDGATWAAMAEMSDECSKALSNFSESHGTDWEGREGELVALTLLKLGDGAVDSKYFENRPALPSFPHVYGIIR